MNRFKFIKNNFLFLIIFLTIFGLIFQRKESENQREKITVSNLIEIGGAINLFKKEFNNYPLTLDDLAPPKGKFLYPSGQILDGWGQPIRYFETKGATKPFNLYSIGVNNMDEKGAGDDLSFWSVCSDLIKTDSLISC